MQIIIEIDFYFFLATWKIYYLKLLQYQINGGFVISSATRVWKYLNDVYPLNVPFGRFRAIECD